MNILILKKIWFYVFLVVLILLFMTVFFYDKDKNFDFLKTLNFYTSFLAIVSPIVSYIMVRISSIRSIFKERLVEKLKEIKDNFDTIKQELLRIKRKMLSADNRSITETDCRVFNDFVNNHLSNIENNSLSILGIRIVEDKTDIISNNIYILLNKVSNNRDNEDALESLYKEISALESHLVETLNSKILECV